MFNPIFMPPGTSEVLVEGVPAWLHRSLESWLSAQLHYFGGYRTEKRVSVVEKFDRVTRRSNPLAPTFDNHGLSAMIARASEEDLLELTNYLVAWNAEVDDPEAIALLEQLLQESGSAWTAVNRADAAGLERRVPQAARDAVEATTAATAAGAGPALSRAWSHAFGRSPDPSRAYGDAIRAVEEASIPVVQPKHPKATLGSVIGQMRSDGNWAVPIEHANKLLVTEMCDQLWSGQTDRHGANNSHAPSQDAAEAAVLLAVTLVQWFSSGAVARR